MQYLWLGKSVRLVQLGKNLGNEKKKTFYKNLISGSGWLMQLIYVIQFSWIAFALTRLDSCKKKKKLASYFLLLFKLIFQKVEIEHYPPFSGKDFE